MCSLCSRLRRGILYRVADELGATKIALGHHRDDILGTFFLNMFYGGTLKAMPPKLVSDDGKHIVIRPLAYVEEADLARYAEVKEFPIIPCNLCGSQVNLKRQEIKRMLIEWQKRYPGRVENTFNALARVTPSHLMDADLFDFAALRASGRPDIDGDIAFDEPPCSDQRRCSRRRDPFCVSPQAAFSARSTSLTSTSLGSHPTETRTKPSGTASPQRARRSAQV